MASYVQLLPENAYNSIDNHHMSWVRRENDRIENELYDSLSYQYQGTRFRLRCLDSLLDDTASPIAEEVRIRDKIAICNDRLERISREIEHLISQDAASDDIETEWSRRLTVIGIQSSKTGLVQIVGHEITKAKLQKELPQNARLISYNGHCFDMPCIKEQLGITSSYDDRTFDVISQVLSLKGVGAISDLSLHKIENDWHNSYIQLNRLLGELEGKKETLRKVNPMGVILNKVSKNPYFNLLLVLIIIFGVYFIVQIS